MVGTFKIGKLASVKQPFLTMFTKMGFLVKTNVLGIWVVFCSEMPGRPFFCFILGFSKWTPCILKVALKYDDGDGRQMLALDGAKCLVQKVFFILVYLIS